MHTCLKQQRMKLTWWQRIVLCCSGRIPKTTSSTIVCRSCLKKAKSQTLKVTFEDEHTDQATKTLKRKATPLSLEQVMVDVDEDNNCRQGGSAELHAQLGVLNLSQQQGDKIEIFATRTSAVSEESQVEVGEIQNHMQESRAELQAQLGVPHLNQGQGKEIASCGTKNTVILEASFPQDGNGMSTEGLDLGMSEWETVLMVPGIRHLPSPIGQGEYRAGEAFRACQNKTECGNALISQLRLICSEKLSCQSGDFSVLHES